MKSLYEVLVKHNIKNEKSPIKVSQLIKWAYGTSIETIMGMNKHNRYNNLESICDECLTRKDFQDVFSNDPEEFGKWLLNIKNEKFDEFEINKGSQEWIVFAKIDNISFTLNSSDNVTIEEIIKVK